MMRVGWIFERWEGNEWKHNHLVYSISRYFVDNTPKGTPEQVKIWKNYHWRFAAVIVRDSVIEKPPSDSWIYL